MIQLQLKNVSSSSLLNFVEFYNIDSLGAKEVYALLELSSGKKLKAEHKHNVHGGFGLRVLDTYDTYNRCAGIAFLKDFAEFYPDCGEADTAAYLSKFVVHPSYRNGGVGEMLLSGARELCKSKGYDTIFFRVDGKNTYGGNGGVKRPIGDFYVEHGDAKMIGAAPGLFGSSAEIYKIALTEIGAIDGSAPSKDKFFVGLVGGIPEDYERPSPMEFTGVPGILHVQTA